MISRPLIAALLAAGLLASSGCSTGAPVSVASNTYPSVPNGFAQEVNLISAKPIAVWVHGGTILAVVTVGSLACAPIPTAISATDETTIALTYVKSPNTPCEGNIGPTTNEFKIPEGIDPKSSVTVEIHFDISGAQDYSVPVER